MNGATRSRKGSSALRKRCPKCKKLRKLCEPPGDVGGELHPRRPDWEKIDGVWTCGWCVKGASKDPIRWVIQLRDPKEGERYYTSRGSKVTKFIEKAKVFLDKALAEACMEPFTLWPKRKVLPLPTPAEP